MILFIGEVKSKMSNTKKQHKLKSYVLISLFSAIIAVLSFISIPAPVPFTLQTLGVFCTLTILGGKYGFISIILYIFLGIIGLPVFSHFSGGIGHLLGATGGYIIGFIPLALTYWVITYKVKSTTVRKAIGLFSGLILCYLLGTLWYTYKYVGNFTTESFISSLSVCVLPFLIPDTIKLSCALLIDKKLNKLINF